MKKEDTIINIERENLLSKVKEKSENGYRLVQMGCTNLKDGDVEVNYSFDLNYEFINFRVKLTANALVLPSISEIYFCAFLYENEIHDLFGISITDIALDYKGKFYKTTEKFPFKAS